MKAIVLVVTLFVFSLCYSISTGNPEEANILDEQADDGRRYLAQARANANVGANMYRPGSPPNFVRTSDSNQLEHAVRPVLGECYSCIDCPKVLFNTTVRQCVYNSPRCIVYSEKYNHLSKPIYVRGCVSERGSCNDVKRSHEGHQNNLKLLSCEECYGEKCNTNGVPKSLPDLNTAIFFLIIIPAIKKYMLS